MTQFNLYFAGQGLKEANPLIHEIGGNRLLSYHLDRKLVDLWTLEYKKPIFLDSGAFSAHTKGAQIDVDDYISFINERDKYLTCFAQLDTIPGEFGKPKTRQQLEEAPEKSWENYLYMYERVKSPEKLLPIFHQGEDFKHLIRILEHSPKVEYMGISPANDVVTAKKAAWIAECFKIIKKSSNPNIKTHAFGMTKFEILEQFPFYSADSTSWLVAGMKGDILTKFGQIPVSSKLQFDKGHYKIHVLNQSEEGLNILDSYLQEFGYTLREVADDWKARMLFNIKYSWNWAQNYEYKPRQILQTKLF